MPAEQAAEQPMNVLAPPPTEKAPAARFTGDVWVDMIASGDGDGTATLATVRFSPGARTAWHRHARGQTLHVTEGCGIVQTCDGRTIVMRPGDTVATPPDTWHWHGATADAFMTHLALSLAGEVEWGEHVTDDDYAAASSGEHERTGR